MIFKDSVNDINSIECRDRMNNKLQSEKSDILITMVNLSRSKNSIIFTVSEKHIAEQLIQCRSIWENEFEFKFIQEDEVWFECIVHGIEISQFDESMTSLRKEIEKYNDFSLTRDSSWLTSIEKRENKTHSSVKISLKNKIDLNKAIKKGTIVNGKSLQTIEFLNTRVNQCHKCQKFEHLINSCKQTTSICRFCAQNHDTRMHICSICNSKEPCPHIPPKCINCDEAHTANDSKCEHFRAIEIKSRKMTNSQSHD
jgi:hypothetical protein